jgi:hypothetical protein
VRRACCSLCLVAAATVLELRPIGSLQAPTSCLCTGCHRPDEVALLPLVQGRRLKPTDEGARFISNASPVTEPRD